MRGRRASGPYRKWPSYPKARSEQWDKVLLRMGLFASALFEAHAFAFYLRDVYTVGEWIEKGSSNRSEPRTSIDSRKGRSLITCVDPRSKRSLSIFKERSGATLGERHEGQFITDEQFVAGDLLLEVGRGSDSIN